MIVAPAAAMPHRISSIGEIEVFSHSRVAFRAELNFHSLSDSHGDELVDIVGNAGFVVGIATEKMQASIPDQQEHKYANELCHEESLVEAIQSS